MTVPDFNRWTSSGGDPSLNDINRVDRFIDAVRSGEPVYSTDPGEAELAFLLADWRDGVREAPDSAVVTDRDAALALRTAQTPRSSGRRSLAVVGSAAAAMLALGGFGTAVYGAGPGDSLYGVRTMFVGEQQATRNDQVVLAAQTELNQVQQLVDQGQWSQAQDRLAALSTTVQGVDPDAQKQDLVQQWNALTYKVVEKNPAASLPPSGEPLPVLSDSPLTLLPIPEIVGPTTTATTTSETPQTSETPTPSDTPGPEVLLTSPQTSISGATGSSTTTSATPTTPGESPTSATPPSTTAKPPSTTARTSSATAQPSSVAATSSVAPTATPTATARPSASPTPTTAPPAAEPGQSKTATETSTTSEVSAEPQSDDESPVTTTVTAPGDGN